MTRAAFDTLVRPHLPRLRGVARRLDPANGEDLLQQALLVAWRRADALRDARAVRVWLGRIVWTTWADRRPTREDVHEDLVAVDARDPEAQAAARELGDALQRALAALPDDQRAVVELIDGLGLSFGEAADALAIPPGTVASRLARGRVALRATLAPHAADRGFSRGSS